MMEQRAIKHYAKKACDLIDEGWTTGSFAKDKDGRSISSLNHSATCFCALGAIYKATQIGDGHLDVSHSLVQYLIDHEGMPTAPDGEDLGVGTIVAWNDAQTDGKHVLRVMENWYESL